MDPFAAVLHLLNFLAPALVVALLTTLLARVLVSNSASAQKWYAQVAINFGVCALVLLGGLWFFGRDGKMASYLVLVLACASSQWLLGRNWRS